MFTFEFTSVHAHIMAELDRLAFPVAIGAIDCNSFTPAEIELGVEGLEEAGLIELYDGKISGFTSEADGWLAGIRAERPAPPADGHPTFYLIGSKIAARTVQGKIDIRNHPGIVELTLENIIADHVHGPGPMIIEAVFCLKSWAGLELLDTDHDLVRFQGDEIGALGEILGRPDMSGRLMYRLETGIGPMRVGGAPLVLRIGGDLGLGFVRFVAEGDGPASALRYGIEPMIKLFAGQKRAIVFVDAMGVGDSGRVIGPLNIIADHRELIHLAAMMGRLNVK